MLNLLTYSLEYSNPILIASLFIINVLLTNVNYDYKLFISYINISCNKLLIKFALTYYLVELLVANNYSLNDN